MDAKETTIYHAVIASGIVLMVFNCIFISCSIWMQRRFIIKKREREEAVIIRMEQERMRIAADLHDATGPLLYSIQKKIENAIDADVASAELLHNAQQQLNKLSEQLHTLSRSMVPLSLERMGLLYCLEEMVLEYQIENDLAIELQCGNLDLINNVEQTHIYRILQEIIQNTIKHSMATALKINVNRNGKMLYIKTKDNGRGFDFEKLRIHSKGLGIGNIETRASFMKGKAVMRNVNGCCWEVRLCIG